MDFDRLRYLAAVARSGSVRGAAAALSVTPGAVSKAIARLEEETGLSLIVPDGRGVRLTDDGQWLAGRAEHLVGELMSLGSDLSDRRGRDPELCLATYDVFVESFPAQLARQFLPGVPLSVRERWPGEVEEAVATGLSDVGITYIPVPTEGVQHREVVRVPLGVFVRRGTFTGVPLAELPFVVASHPVSGAVGQYGPLDGWPADAPPRRVAFRASALEARMELVRQGAAAVLMPVFAAEQHNRRVRATHALEPWPLPRSVGRLQRRVHVVSRSGATGLLASRVESVVAAVKAACSAC